MTPLERLRAELAGDDRIDSRRMVVVTAADLALALVVVDAAEDWESSTDLTTDRDAAARLTRALRALSRLTTPSPTGRDE